MDVSWGFHKLGPQQMVGVFHGKPDHKTDHLVIALF